MKRFVLVLFTLIAVSYSAKSQSLFQFGVKAGGLSNWIINARNLGDGDTTYKASFGYTVGVTGGFYFNNRSYYSHKLKGIELGISYTGINQGFRTKEGSLFIKNYRWNLSYLDISAMFTIFPIADDGFYFQVGPQYSILLGAKATGSATKDPFGNQLAPSFSGVDIKPNLSGGNIHAAMEMGKYFNSRSSTHMGIKVGVRLDYGFTDITKPSKPLSGSPYSKNNIAFVGLVLGFQFSGANYYN